MFESAISLPTPDQATEGALRQLEWSELVARLGAVRDMRALFARAAPQGGGFVPRAAAGISGSAPGERGVNLAGLSGSKWADAITAAAASCADHGDRDKR